MRYKTIVIYVSIIDQAEVIKRSWSFEKSTAKAEEVVRHGFLKYDSCVYPAKDIIEVRIYKGGNIVKVVKGARTP